MSLTPRRATLLVAAACGTALALRLPRAPGSLYNVITRSYQPVLTWNEQIPDGTQFWHFLPPYLWAALPSFVAALLFVVVFTLIGGRSEGRELPALGLRWIGLPFTLLVGVRTLWFGGTPIITDERAYRFQAEILQRGRLWVEPPANPEAFHSSGIYLKDIWTSSYQPGWPAVLALAQVLHLDRWANCAWWLVIAWSIYRLGKRLWDERAAAYGALFFALSSTFWFAAWSDFPHLQTAALGLLSWDGFLIWRTSQRLAWPAALGTVLCWAGVAITRVQDFPVVMAVPTVWLLVSAPGRLRGLGLITAGTAFSVASVLLLNFWQTGSPTRMPIELYLGSMAGHHHSIWRALFNLCFYLCRIAWWMPPYFLVFLVLRRPRSLEWGLWGGIAAQVLFYLPYYSLAGGEWGARFYTISLVLGCLLAGAALSQVALERAALAILVGVGLLQGAQITWLGHENYLLQGGANWAMLDRELAEAPSVVFVRRVPEGEEADAAIVNHVDLHPPVFALWLDPAQNEEIRLRYPGCRYRVLDFPPGEKPILSDYPLADPRSSQAYYRGGVNYWFQLHDPVRALDCLQKSLPTENPAATYGFIGGIQKEAGMLPEAAESMRRSLDLNPHLTIVRFRYAILLRELKKIEEARPELERVLQESPDSPEGREARRLLTGP